MKKIYTYVALTTIISLSTTCMELQLERKKTEPLNIQAPTFSFDTLNNLQTNRLPTMIHKKYSDLDYVPVYTTINPDELELTPVYRPIFTSIEERSTTEYLDCITKTKKMIPQEESAHNKYLKERLYNSGRELIDFLSKEDESITKNDHIIITRNKKLIILIDLMIEAKKKGITEDFMGNFAYKKLHDHTSFIFQCLKKYLLTIDEFEEKQPSKIKNFDISNATVNDIKEISLIYCPTYKILLDIIKELSEKVAGWDTGFIPYLYASTKILSEKYSQYSHIINLNECFDILESCLCREQFFSQYLYESLNLIEHIKKLKQIKEGKDLGYNFLILEKQQSFKEKLFRYPKTTYSTHNKNLIAFFCILMEKYNKDRGNKVTPTHIQLGIYNLRKEIALPDSFDTNLLDNNYYALEELHELALETIKLKKFTASQLQDLVDKHYIFDVQ